MQTKNLEQKIGLMDKFRSVARRTVGAYALVSALAFWGIAGCDKEKNGEEDNSYKSDASGSNYSNNNNNSGSNYSNNNENDHSNDNVGNDFSGNEDNNDYDDYNTNNKKKR